jgi:hypothetical protein
MANAFDYYFRLFNCTGQYIGDFDTIISAEFGRQKNEIGMCEIVVPNIYDLSLFTKDSILEIWRKNIATGKKQLLGRTCWFLRKIQLCREEGQQETLTLTFYDTIHILSRRVVAWFEVKRGVGEDEFPSDYPSAYIGYPDIILDQIVYHNFIEEGLFTSPSSPSFLGFAINLHELIGATRTGFPMELVHIGSFPRDTDVEEMTYTFAYENCLEAMQSIVDTAEAVENRELWFDIIYTPVETVGDATPTIGTFAFDCWWDYMGEDHVWPNSGEPLLFGPDYENIVNACLVLDWENEATQVIAMSGSADNTVSGLETYLANGVTIPSSASYAELEEANGCPFYPIEAIVTDNRSQNNTNTMPGDLPDLLDSTTTKAFAELRKRSAVHTLSGDILQTDGALLFVDYNYGDRITVDWKGLTFDATVKKFMITVDNEGENITIPFEGSVRERAAI